MQATSTTAAAHAPRAGRASHSRLESFLRSNSAMSLALLVVLLLFWEFGVRIFNVPKFLIPPFSDVVAGMIRGFSAGPLAKDGFWYHSFITLFGSRAGFLHRKRHRAGARHGDLSDRATRRSAATLHRCLPEPA